MRSSRSARRRWVLATAFAGVVAGGMRLASKHSRSPITDRPKTAEQEQGVTALHPGMTFIKEVEDLERRSYNTYRARMVAAERLRSRHNAWSTSLLAVTTGAVIASVALLVVPTLYGTFGGLFLAALSVLTLAVSLATTGLNYAARSRDMFINYRKVQRISVEAENLLRLPVTQLDASTISDLQLRYQALLDESENHAQADYELAGIKGVHVTQMTVFKSRFTTFLPYGLLIFPVALMVPVVKAVVNGL